MKKIAILLLFIGLQKPQAQTASTDIKKNSVQITFTTDRVDNLLVLVSDSAGRTIFLDNPYNFKGFYQKNLLLPKTRGRYFLTINKDGVKTRQLITVE